MESTSIRNYKLIIRQATALYCPYRPVYPDLREQLSEISFFVETLTGLESQSGSSRSQPLFQAPGSDQQLADMALRMFSRMK